MAHVGGLADFATGQLMDMAQTRAPDETNGFIRNTWNGFAIELDCEVRRVICCIEMPFFDLFRDSIVMDLLGLERPWSESLVFPNSRLQRS